MGQSKKHPPCLQLIAAFSQDTSILEMTWNRVRASLGDILLLSPPFEFTESEYYRTSMGASLKKQFSVLVPWYDPARLAEHKNLANDWEDEVASDSSWVVTRPLNVDPGYLSMTKLVLASTKNREHRIYLRDGIYAEVTLAFRDQQWQSMPWTYPDYQREDFQSFFLEARKLLHQFINQDKNNS
jgi:hypothetical protein